MMGDGVHRLRQPSAAGSPTPGTTGDVEVEIFNADIWAAPADEVLSTMSERWRALVLPSL